MLHRRFAAICVLALACAAAALGQARPEKAVELALRGVPLAEALEVLVRETHADLVYESDLLAGKRSFCVAREADPEKLLQCVLKGTGVDYVRSRSGAYILIAAVRQPPRWGTLAGSVIDEATGEPLPNANILLAEARTGTAANEAGFFTLTSLISGPYRLMATHVGYETVEDSVFIEPGSRHRIRIAMRSRPAEISPIVVDGLQQRMPSQGLGGAVPGAAAARELASTPAWAAARAAAALPGVYMQRPLADLHLQGGSAGSHVVLLDGATVREPVSLGRHLGAFSPIALGRLHVHRAGFGASKGSNLTGVVAVQHDAVPTRPADFALQGDHVALNARARGRFDAGSTRGSGMIAVRSSLWDIYRASYLDDLFRRWHEPDPLTTSLWLQQPVSPASLELLGQSPDVHFSDVHAAGSIGSSPYHRVDASIYHARNRLGSVATAVNRPEQEEAVLFATNDLYDWTNWAGQVRHSWLAGGRLAVSTQLTGSSHESRYTYGAASAGSAGADDELLRRLERDAGNSPSTREAHQIRELTLTAEAHYSVSLRTHITAGAFASKIDSRFRFGSPFIAPFRSDAYAWHAGGFVEGDLRLGERTSLEPGVRVTYVLSRGSTYLEPRLAVRYDREKLAARLSGGTYRQFVNEFELTGSGSTSVIPFVFFWMPVDATVAPPRAHHLAGDVLLMPSSRWTLNLSVFYKQQPRLLVLDYPGLVTPVPQPGPTHDGSRLQQRDFVTAARGNAAGGEVRVERIGDRHRLAGGYALTHVRRTIPGRFADASRPVHWSAPHNLFAQGRLGTVGNLEVEGSVLFSAGRRWPYRNSYYDFVVARVPPGAGLDDPGEGRLPPAFTIDAGARYVLGPLHLRVMVLNVLGHHEVYERVLFRDADRFSSGDRRLPGRSLFLSVRATI